MKLKSWLVCIAALFISLCGLKGYAQVVVSSQDGVPPIEINYLSPKKYEIGGITSSGNANFDQRMLNFGVGSIIEIPGDDISKSIKRLWNSGYYEKIDITITNVIDNKVFLNVNLEERARLVAFGFKGTTKNEENEIREKIKLTQGNIVNDNMKQTCVNIIKNYYVEKGFYNCEVQVEEQQDSKVSRGVRLLFNVKKNKKVKIARISIIGNEEVSKAKLLKPMKETKEKFKFQPFYKLDTAIAYCVKHKGYYQSKDILEHMEDYFSDRVKLRIFKASKFIEESYESNKVAMINKYNELGYRDAYITKDSVYIKGNNIYIDIYVNEGHKYYFRNISFVGNTKYPSSTLKKLLNINKGDVYNQTQLMNNLNNPMQNDLGNDVSSLYMNDGYLFFTATPVEVMIENDSIDIEIRIREGKQARYNKVYVTGNTKTNDNVIMREITTIPGQLFNRADIIRTQQVLLSLGYFNQESMNVIPKPNEADGTVDIEYVVEEASSDQLSLSAGYGAGTFVISAGIAFNNFSFKKFFKKEAWTPIPGGDGQRLAFNVSTNAKYYQNYSLSFTEPWLGGKKPISLTAGIYYQVQTDGTKRNTANHVEIRTIGASLSIARKVKWPDDYFQISHTLSYQRYQVQNYSYFIFKTGYANSLSYIFTIARNSISAPIYPREGSEIMFSVQLTPPYSLFKKGVDYSTLSAQDKYKWLEFHKWKLNVSWYTRIVENLVFFVRMKMGFMGCYNKNIGASPFERFYLGGDGLSTYTMMDAREVIGMRGYDDYSLSPYVDGNEIGGTIYNKFTAEIRYPITLNPSATIYLLAFAEAGKAWLDKRQYSPFNMYKSAGVGVRIYLPMFGLLGFDWGYGFDEVPGLPNANKGRFHISINQSID